jgi:hypothetical protein
MYWIRVQEATCHTSFDGYRSSRRIRDLGARGQSRLFLVWGFIDLRFDRERRRITGGLLRQRKKEL